MSLKYNSIEDMAAALGLLNESQPQPESQPESAPVPAPVAHLQVNPAYAQLYQIAAKALHYGQGQSTIIRNGSFALVFHTGDSRDVFVECMAHETWITVVESGRTMAKNQYPALSAYELLKALPLEVLKIYKVR